LKRTRTNALVITGRETTTLRAERDWGH
jgi:hypothetical protein